MFYIICDGMIVDSSDRRPTHEEVKQWANDLDAEAYVIRGEHAGITEYPDDKSEDNDLDGDE